jgi:lipopolysaccharide/colanic/teichoic acid biosynthesis glycosyltransferase
MPAELSKMNGLAQAVLQSPPGITGLWQVSGRNHLSFSDRVSLDVHYIQNWSPWLDLYLLVRTVPVVFTGDGAA